MKNKGIYVILCERNCIRLYFYITAHEEKFQQPRNEVNMLGKPKYSKKDIVEFKFDDKILKGEIRIVDIWGSMECNMDVSYDIFRAENNTLYKHIPEEDIERRL